MSTIKNLAAGLGGAIALNIINESLKKTGSDMPRIDLLGEQAIQKSAHFLGGGFTDDDHLYLATLSADVLGNSLYYSAIGAGGPTQFWKRAVALGLGAGFSAVALPKQIGLNPAPVARTHKVQALTVAYYLAGALVTAGILQAMTKKPRGSRWSD